MLHQHPIDTAHGQKLAQPSAAYLDDHGDADPAVRAALAAAGDQLGYLRAVVALGGARLLMPIVASGDDGMGGPDLDRHAEMAAVTIENAQGEKALLAFTGIDSMTAWSRDARPVLGTLDEMCATVAEAGATHLLVDVAGPVQFVLGPDVAQQAAKGHRLIELEDGGFGWMYLAEQHGGADDQPADSRPKATSS